MVAIGGLYNADLAIWPNGHGANGHLDEKEQQNFSGPAGSTGYSVALTFMRPVMSQTVGGTGKTVSGTICTFAGNGSFIKVNWHTDNRLDIVCNDGVNEETIELELGFWFRTWPIVLIISYDTENGRTEASALSSQKGLVSGGASISVPWSVLHWGDENGANVYNLIVCGAAYADYYMDYNDRETELTYLDFLTPP